MVDDWLQAFSGRYREPFYLFLRRLQAREKAFVLHSDLIDEFAAMCEESDKASLTDSPLARFVGRSQEATVDAPWFYFAVRPEIAEFAYVQVHLEAMEAIPVTASQYLRFKERLLRHAGKGGVTPIEIDLEPFGRTFPKMKEARSIGRGMEFLNRHLSSRLFDHISQWDRHLIDFLRVHNYRGRQLLLNRQFGDASELRRSVRQGLKILGEQADDASWFEIEAEMRGLGFEVGWGRSIERIRVSLELLSEILEAPDAATLERFLGRMPMIFSIGILSPHGYFGQDKVLGMPDTGGQVVYILNQVRALEREMRRRIWEQGLDVEPQILVTSRLIPEAEGTTCDQRIEPIAGTCGARILRVPFRGPDGEIIPNWISRFQIWPYLERFARDAEKEMLAELGGKPDLVIGNYSDGNLVASILAHRMGVTQCNIAHALEKTKYLMSDLYWEDLDPEYHFSCQFTADLIAMNAADFIITSTYQEIAGTPESMGQYESYAQYTMPGLYRVVNGIELFDPKFNIVSPGGDPEVHFPYTDRERRVIGLHGELEEMIYGPNERPNARGRLASRDRPLIFTMARLDRIKNVTQLVRWYAENTRLRGLADMLVVGGFIDPSRSRDKEEREQIGRMHELMDRFQLDSNLRWLCAQHDKTLTGELYRYVADRRGVFVQPALFEAFGLTVVEAMATGLPTFATRYGGPLEIIEKGVSGFHIDPNHGDEAADLLADFLESCEQDPDRWEQISKGAIERVSSRYTWELYAERMMTLSRIYGFWKHVTHLERDETRRYLEILYGLLYRPLAEKLLAPGN